MYRFQVFHDADGGAAGAMRSAHDELNTPEAEMISQLGKSMQKTVDELKEQNATLQRKLDEATEKASADQDKLRKEFAAGFEKQDERVEALEKKQTVYPYRQSMASDIVQAIPKEYKKSLIHIDATFQKDHAWGETAEEEAGSLLWMLFASMSQMTAETGNRDTGSFAKAADDLWTALSPGVNKTDFASDVDAMGGHLAPHAVARQIYRLINDHTVVRPLADVIPMPARTMDLPKRGSGAVTSEFITSQGTTVSDSYATPQLAQLALVAATHAGRGVASIESVQDSGVGLMAYLRQLLIEQMGIDEDTQALEGTGSPFTGIAGDSDVNEVAAGTNGDAITFDKLVDIMLAPRQRSSRQVGRWFMSDKALGQVIKLRADAVSASDNAGATLFMFGDRVQGGGFNNLLGYPIEEHTGILTNRTKGSGTNLTNIYFGNPKFITFADRAGVSWTVTRTGPSMHNNEFDFMLTKRGAIGINTPGGLARGVDLLTS